MLSYEASKLIVQWFLSALMFLVRLCMICWVRIILKNVLHKATNLYQFVQIDPSNRNIRKSAADIDIGFAGSIKVDESNLKPNDPKVLAFKKEAGKCFAAVLSHLEKSPLN